MRGDTSLAGTDLCQDLKVHFMLKLFITREIFIVFKFKLFV